jgi:hypothetical protein
MECEKCPIKKECRSINEALPKIGFAPLVKHKCPLINMGLLYPLRGIADLCEEEGNPKKAEKLRKVISEYEL